LLEDLLSNRALAAHGIDGHETASHDQVLQEVGQGGDLIRLGIDFDLGEHQPVRRRPGTDHVDGSLPGGVVRSPDRLAIEGDHLGREDGAHRLHPGLEALLELDGDPEGAPGGKHPVEGVMGGDAMGQIQASVGRAKRGDPLGIASHSSLASPNCSMSSQLSAPLMTAQMAIAMMLSNGWRRVRSTRGSSREVKCSTRVGDGEDGMVASTSKVGLSHPTHPRHSATLDAFALQDECAAEFWGGSR
jgi:hypothetical protein